VSIREENRMADAPRQTKLATESRKSVWRCQGNFWDFFVHITALFSVC